MPQGFELAANLGKTQLAAGEITTFTVRLTATAAGSYGGTLTLHTSDQDENPFTLSGAVELPVPAEPFHIVSAAPAGLVGSFDSLPLNFSSPVDAAAFTTADILTLL